MRIPGIGPGSTAAHGGNGGAFGDQVLMDGFKGRGVRTAGTPLAEGLRALIVRIISCYRTEGFANIL